MLKVDPLFCNRPMTKGYPTTGLLVLLHNNSVCNNKTEKMKKNIVCSKPGSNQQFSVILAIQCTQVAERPGRAPINQRQTARLGSTGKNVNGLLTAPSWCVRSPRVTERPSIQSLCVRLCWVQQNTKHADSQCGVATLCANLPLRCGRRSAKASSARCRRPVSVDVASLSKVQQSGTEVPIAGAKIIL